MTAPDAHTCACVENFEQACANPLCPRRPVHLRQVEPPREPGTPRPVPAFPELPTGVLQIRRNILYGVTSLDMLRAAGACRRSAYSIRRQLTHGLADPAWEPRMEDQVTTLTLMEGVLANLGGALREAERRERVEAERKAEVPADAA